MFKVVMLRKAQGMDFPKTVAPFILRGITLAGVVVDLAV